MKSAQLEKILQRHGNQSSNVLAVLQDIQASENYLPRKTLEEVAQKLQIPLTQIYHLATFYRAFSLNPRGRHLVTVCTGTACHVRQPVIKNIPWRRSIVWGPVRWPPSW
jgi:NADH-quinone oxidoreductase subunit E